jgi:hypothetical protein
MNMRMKGVYAGFPISSKTIKRGAGEHLKKSVPERVR